MSSAVSCNAGRSPGYFPLNLSGSAAMPDEEGCRAERVAESTDRPKGMLTMEYQAMALREGWADFVSAYTFNYVSQDDCTFGEWGFVKNFDLDDDDKDADVDEGQWDNPIANHHFDYDNASTPGQMVNVAVAPTDGWLSCDGPPLTTALCTAWGMPCNDMTVGPDWEQVPLKAVATGPDWLEGVYGFAGTCGGGLGLTNRSTAYDWARFFWDLATERDVPAETLSDLLVNMTPSTLDPDDNGTSTTTDEDQCGSDTTADDVTVRLLDAAANTWCFDCPIPGFLSDEVALEVEHGQDH
jgi:hypothetical protein